MGVAVFFDRASNHKRKILIGLLEAFHDEEGTLDAVVAKGKLVELLCMRLQVRLYFLHHRGDDLFIQILGGEGEPASPGKFFPDLLVDISFLAK